MFVLFVVKIWGWLRSSGAILRAAASLWLYVVEGKLVILYVKILYVELSWKFSSLAEVHTIILHPLLADHLRAYQFEERDVIEGMFFGNEDLYINTSQHNLRNHMVSKCYGNVSSQPTPIVSQKVYGQPTERRHRYGYYARSLKMGNNGDNKNLKSGDGGTTTLCTCPKSRTYKGY